jgi:hypothetical protein
MMDDRVQGNMVVSKRGVIVEDWVCRTNDEGGFGQKWKGNVQRSAIQVLYDRPWFSYTCSRIYVHGDVCCPP